jgi:ABC transporter with metal-binding/Fe-S-binding domain ATP-binding protein
MKVAVLFSGGKDSTFAIYKAQQMGHEISCLISFIPKNKESYMFHVPNIEWAALQAEALGLSSERFEVEGVKEEEVKEMEIAIGTLKEKYKFEGLVCGALASKYQKERVEKVAKALGLHVVCPFWDKDQIEYVKEMLKEGFKIKFTGVFADGFTPEWLGKDLDQDRLDMLIKLNKDKKISVGGEGGEYETFAYDGPIFKKKVEFVDSQIMWKDNSGVLDVKDAKLVEKT